MPSYDFVCEACGHAYELTQSMREPLPTACPHCREQGERFHQVYAVNTLIIVKGDVTTVGQQAEKNARRVGKEQLAKMAEAHSISNRRARQKLGVPLGEGAKPARKTTGYKRPWWRPNTDERLDIKKVKNVKRFIEEGQ